MRDAAIETIAQCFTRCHIIPSPATEVAERSVVIATALSASLSLLAGTNPAHVVPSAECLNRLTQRAIRRLRAHFSRLLR